jgi:hypothetical protein
MSGSVKQLHGWRGVFGKVMMIDPLTAPVVHVLNSDVDPKCSCQGTDVNMVALTVHGINLLQQEPAHRIHGGDSCFGHHCGTSAQASLDLREPQMFGFNLPSEESL